MSRRGIEPGARKGEDSTKLCENCTKVKKKRSQRGSNPRPQGQESNPLPARPGRHSKIHNMSKFSKFSRPRTRPRSLLGFPRTNFEASS